MIAPSVTADAVLARIVAGQFADMPARCGRGGRPDESPGLIDEAPYRDWSTVATTDDQARIERRLLSFVRPDSRILHVGVGNSKLAQRFAPRVAAIDGLTISEHEVARARALGLANYSVRLRSKYHPDDVLPAGRFDAIVDNNPTSFACCLTHLAAMTAWYANLLADDGAVFTDRQGLAWVLAVADARPGSGFDFARWSSLGAAAGLESSDIDGSVHVWFKPAGRQRIARLRDDASAANVMLGMLPVA